MTRAAVFGSGSWGTAFAAVLADAGGEVVLHARRAEVADAINADRVNADYLPELTLPESISATHDPAAAARGADLVVLAIPSQTVRANLGEWGHHLPAGVPVVSLMKGIELGTGLRMSQVIEQVGGVPTDQVVVVSGPNLSREIAARQPAASVVACSDLGTAEQVALNAAAGVVFAAAGAVVLWREWKAYQYAKAHKDDPDTWTREDALPEDTDTDADADADRGGDGT